MIVQIVKNLGTIVPFISRPRGFPLLLKGQRCFCSYPQVQERIRKLSLAKDAMKQHEMAAQMDKLQNMIQKQAETGDFNKAFDMSTWKCQQIKALTGDTSDEAIQQAISCSRWAAAHYRIEQAHTLYAEAKEMQSKKQYNNEQDKLRQTKEIEKLLEEIKCQQEKRKNEAAQYIQKIKSKLEATNEKLSKLRVEAEKIASTIKKKERLKMIVEGKIGTVSQQWHIEPILTYSTLANLGFPTKWDTNASLQSVLAYLEAHPQLDQHTCHRGICLFILTTRGMLIGDDQIALQYGQLAVQELTKHKYLNPETEHMTVNIINAMACIHHRLELADNKKQEYYEKYIGQIERRVQAGKHDRAVADSLIMSGRIYSSKNSQQEALAAFKQALFIYETLYPEQDGRTDEIRIIILSLNASIKEIQK